MLEVVIRKDFRKIFENTLQEIFRKFFEDFLN